MARNTLTRRLIVGAAVLLALAGAGTGEAMAQTAPARSTSRTPNPTAPPRADSDHVRPGDQRDHDRADSRDLDAHEPADHRDSVESTSDPERNHQDPNGANADHTPSGERPALAGAIAED